MRDLSESTVALAAPNRKLDFGGRTLAYRMLGQGPHLVLCLRLHGTMDAWDPLFIDRLAVDFTVVLFDYSGFGYSTGAPSYAEADMARDVHDLIVGLGLDTVILGGWSLGGFAALAYAATHPERVTHVLAIATTPPGPMVKPSEPVFLEVATQASHTKEDAYLLFFEPDSPRSRALGDASLARLAARNEVFDRPTPPKRMNAALRASLDPTTPFPDTDGAYARFYRGTDIPVLALCGDHDPIFPVENWHAVNDDWPTLFIATYPDSGHGPHHQYPALAADLIASFVRNA